MMSSEEDTEYFGLYGDKLLKKQKRARQRVDAGEPRNSYSSIPNFSSRPSFMSSGGLYGALLSQSQQHFGLFGPNGFGSAKMLNELFGRQVKQAQDASGPVDNMLAMESASDLGAMGGNGGMGGVGGSNKHGFESASSNSSPIVRRTSSSSGTEIESGGCTSPQQQQREREQREQQQQQNDLAHHMLRNILQGKKELMALDHELRSASRNGNSILCDRSSPENNNSISKNNNNNLNTSSNNNKNSSNSSSGSNNNNSSANNNCVSNNISGNSNNSVNTTVNCALQDVKSEHSVTSVNSGGANQLTNISGSGNNGIVNSSSNCSKQNLSKSDETMRPNSKNNSNNNDSDNENDLQDTAMTGITKKESDELLDDEMMGLNSRSDLESLGSPGSDDNDVMEAKDELEAELEKDLIATTLASQSQNLKPEPVALDMKRARVENIVSSMRTSPTQPQVNGCKKRKLYQPQQHDNSAAERYAAVAAGLNLGLNIQSMILDEDEEDEVESPQIQQKRVEKNALKSQLRSMQEQLAEMQQKYVQLCSRMEQESECQELDDTASDILEQDDSDDIIPQPIEKSQVPTRSPIVSPLKDMTSKTSGANNSPHMLSQMMSKMMTSKLQNPLVGHPHMSNTFNGAHPLLQHIQHNVPNEHPMQNPHMQHHAISNAAAMYQKFFLEQEARMAKEVAEHHERQQQQQQHQQQHQQQQQQQQQQQHHHQQQQHQQLQQVQQQHQPPQQQQQQQQQMHHHHQQHNQQQQHNQGSSQVSNQSSSLNQVTNQHPPPSQSQMHQQQSQQQQPPQQMNKMSAMQSDISEKFNIIRSNTNSLGPMSGSDLEGLADILKSEITASLSTLVDSIVTRFVHQRRFLGKQSEAAAAAAEQLNKDLLMASQLLDRKSPRTKVAEQQQRSNPANQSGNGPANPTNNQPINSSISHPSNSMISNPNSGPRINGSAFPPMGLPMHVNGPQPDSSNSSNINSLSIPPHVRPSPSAAMFQAPKPPQGMNPVAAAALYNSMNALSGHPNQVNPFCLPEPREQNQEQNEALSLVVTPKKKRHKVTDTRITPRTVSRILAQDGIGPQQSPLEQGSSNSSHNKFNNNPPVSCSVAPTSTPSESPSPRSSYHPPPPPASMMPVSLPTSVAIPNPSLHESQVFSPYSPFFNPHGPHGPHGPHAPQPNQLHHIKMSSSPPGLGSMMDSRDSPPLPHPPTMLHPALLAAAHHGTSPDYGHLRAAMDANDRNSDCNSGDISFDGIQPTISFSNANNSNKKLSKYSLTPMHSSTLTPMHLRKAKLMFFWVRYPSSAVLKMYFPDIKFNKNNTAQLVKWFSNFREFYYIQMEKYARQAVTEGVKSADDLHVGGDSELYRVLNLHYNRNNHIEVPQNFRYVVEQTLREFFRAIQGGKDTEQSWKKSIYKIISRLDDPVPEYFKSPNFLEQLE